MTILDLLNLSPEQAEAALSDRPAVAVTAGAAAARTLAGRYLWHIEQGHAVRSLVAVTFTEKGGAEMRNRIRGFISDWRNQVAGGEERALWIQAFVDLDAARIGTIHSLCVAILRSHPAEAGIDPMFEVLEENTAILLQTRAVEQALAWAIDDPASAQLFGPLNERGLRGVVSELLAKRLDAQPAFLALKDDALTRWSQAAAAWFDENLGVTEWRQAVADLAAISAEKADDKMEMARRDVLAHWQTVEDGRARGDWDAVVSGLYAMRKSNSSHGAKGNWSGDGLNIARAAMKTLRDFHDEQLKPLLGTTPPSWALDVQAADLQPGLQRLFAQCLEIYDGMKEERHALDFDDLESRTAALLTEHPDVSARWQSDTAAVLVDEFQDTNARQRQIIYHLTGFTRATHLRGASHVGSLFVVGDGKQSIYRFHGADVTVFRQTQLDIAAAAGQAVDLDTTYRAHRSLVQTLNDLLAPIMGEEDDPLRPHLTPFAPLQAFRTAPALPVDAPWLEFHLGLGNADEGRTSAAVGLAARLHQLHEQGCEWEDIALLFRASTAFGFYEDALENAGIPFVTVAGRGFYDRPEIRDLLNALAAIADPTDDLAVAGLLRSPLFGLTDAALFLLRWGQESGRDKLGFRDALEDKGRLDALDDIDERQARRARSIADELHELAGRQSVAFVLKQLLDRTQYRAALRLADGGERAWRNVDKLLADAHRSRLIGISDFLDYVHNIRDAAVREGEAVAEAENAVQLMTIHKSKGLEFPIVVLADAGYSGGYRAPNLLLDETLGPLLRIKDEDDSDAKPLAFQLGALRQQDMEEAESKRLLYVAATRAAEKLLISGYGRVSTSKQNAGKLMLSGWLIWLGEVVGLGEIQVDEPLTSPTRIALPWHDGDASLDLYPALDPDQRAGEVRPSVRPLASDLRPLPTDLIAPLPAPAPPDPNDEQSPDKEADPPRRVWRVADVTRDTPNWVIGTLVHRALQYWRFPDQAGFATFLRPFAQEKGLISEREIERAVGETARLLKRFQGDPLFKKLNRSERLHEVAYSLELEIGLDSGVIDLIARDSVNTSWTVYDFKTDQLRHMSDLDPHIKIKYEQQITRYATALERLLGDRPATRFVFLNVGGRVVVALGSDAP